MIINIYGVPGTGKSFVAAELFALLTRRGFDVELIHLPFNSSKDRLNQVTRKLLLQVPKSEFVIIDDPYPQWCFHKNKPIDLKHTERTLNFLIAVGEDYDPTGSYMSETKALKMEEKLKNYLSTNDIRLDGILDKLYASVMIMNSLGVNRD